MQGKIKNNGTKQKIRYAQINRERNRKQHDGKNNYELKLLINKLKATCKQKQIKTTIKRCSKNIAESI
jgi:hypothetical protein